MITARLYMKTGFNSVNIPNTKSIFEHAVPYYDGVFHENVPSYMDVPSLDIYSIYNLRSVRLKIDSTAEIRSIQLADFLRLTSGSKSAFYIIDGYEPVALDCYEVRVTPDGITTLGGFDAVSGHITDGIIDRRTVSPLTDYIGRYNIPDPLLMPSQPLKIAGGWTKTEEEGWTIVVSNVDLVDQGLERKIVSYTDSQGNKVDVPAISPVKLTTTVTVQQRIGSQNESRDVTNPGQEYFVMRTPTGTEREAVKDGIANANALSTQNVVIDSYAIPASMVDLTEAQRADGTHPQAFYGDVDEIKSQGGYFSTGSLQNMVEIDTHMKWDPHTTNYTTKNNRIMTSEYCEYHILTAGGSDVGFNPADIVQSGMYTDGNYYPDIRWMTDPRPDGKPYWRWRFYKGKEDNFFLNAVPGASWQKAPIAYTAKPGYEIERMRYDATRRIAEQSLTEAGTRYKSEATTMAYGALSGVVSSIASIASGNLGVGFDRAFSTMANLTAREQTMTWEIDDLKRRYKIEAENQLIAAGVSESTYIPQVTFPINPSIVRDLKGNGAYLYRYYYDLDDYMRVDRLLTMYGYKVQFPVSNLVASLGRQRKYFDYYAITGAKIGNEGSSLGPLSMCKVAEAQLEAGVRVWYDFPDYVTAYEENPAQ